MPSRHFFVLKFLVNIYAEERSDFSISILLIHSILFFLTRLCFWPGVNLKLALHTIGHKKIRHRSTGGFVMAIIWKRNQALMSSKSIIFNHRSTYDSVYCIKVMELFNIIGVEYLKFNNFFNKVGNLWQ